MGHPSGRVRINLTCRTARQRTAPRTLERPQIRRGVRPGEKGKAESILSISAENAPRDLKTWLAAAHAESGLLRFDIDGETFYAYEEPDESDEVVYEYEEQDKAGNVFDVSETAVYDHMHPTTASLKAAVNRYPRNK